MVVLQRAVKYSWHTWAQPSVIFLLLHSLNNCGEVHAILNALCNSQDVLLFFLLSTPSSLWAVICSQAAELFLISFPPHCSPCLSQLLSLCPTFFIWGYVSSLVRDRWLENERNASQLFVKKSYSPFYLKGLNLDYSRYGFKTRILVPPNIWGIHTPVDKDQTGTEL